LSRLVADLPTGKKSMAKKEKPRNLKGERRDQKMKDQVPLGIIEKKSGPRRTSGEPHERPRGGEPTGGPQKKKKKAITETRKGGDKQSVGMKAASECAG